MTKIPYLFPLAASNVLTELSGISTQELLSMLAPIIILQLGIAIYCLFLIWTKGVSSLNRWIWSAFVLFVNLLGPIAFLLFGRKRWQDDDKY